MSEIKQNLLFLFGMEQNFHTKLCSLWIDEHDDLGPHRLHEQQCLLTMTKQGYFSFPQNKYFFL